MINKTTKNKAASKKVAKKKVEKKKIIIQFNHKVLSTYVEAEITRSQQNEKKQIIESMKFLNDLSKQIKLNFQTFRVNFNDPLYRVYPSQWSVTSISGSLSSGARLNIGGSQVLKKILSIL